MEIVFWATIFSLTMAFIGGAIIAWGKYHQDKNSSKNSSQTLENTETAIKNTNELNEKSDTTILGINFLKSRNKMLEEQIDTLQTELIKKIIQSYN